MAEINEARAMYEALRGRMRRLGPEQLTHEELDALERSVYELRAAGILPAVDPPGSGFGAQTVTVTGREGDRGCLGVARIGGYGRVRGVWRG